MTDDGLVEAAGSRLPVDGDAPRTTEVEVLVRPENITVAADPQGEATVVSASFLGSVTRVLLDLPDGSSVKADLPSRDAGALTPGVRAAVGLAQRPVLVVPAAR
ncbi:TOBE domain-containing protein [Streptomyces sp. NBC_01481]|uniref:TOBE domain-containing protein n=1 Tax=Streptomyces sp. NBC_01481 TaxID=2975869 RepID=UPI002254ACAD|nr:TOBE domain-containing protein [Streptomyces sp. NBC_01481]MCX4582264.1 TOBE domain-containing protein [Streptomyces sp. NBC_01481]